MIKRPSLLAILMLWLVPASMVLASHDWVQFYSKTKISQVYRIFSYTDSDANNNRAAPWQADYG